MKKIKLPKSNQIEYIKDWIKFYNINKKLPYDQLFCSYCNKKTVKLPKQKLVKLLIDSYIKKILSECVCRPCIKFQKETDKNLKPKEKSTVKKILSRQELEDNAEKISADLPRVNVLRPITTVYLLKNREACERETKSNCLRPDIFLRNRNCDDCHLAKWCICPIRKFSKYYKNY